jgi:hypothetical protein
LVIKKERFNFFFQLSFAAEDNDCIGPVDSPDVFEISLQSENLLNIPVRQVIDTINHDGKT